jgi:hypothetical protein
VQTPRGDARKCKWHVANQFHLQIGLQQSFLVQFDTDAPLKEPVFLIFLNIHKESYKHCKDNFFKCAQKTLIGLMPSAID